MAGLDFKDEAETINALIPQLQRRGAKAIVVLIHQGGTIPVAQAVSTINNCDGNLADSPLKAIVNHLSDSVDLVISGHTHQAYNCLVATQNGIHTIPVTSANSQGRVFTDIDFVINARTGRVQSVNAINKLVDRTNTAVIPDAGVKQIVDNYKALVQPIANRVIGSITDTLSRTANGAGESTMGDVIADAQLAATKDLAFGGAVVASLNPGGIRENLTFTSSNASEGDGNVTFGEAFTVQHFGNSLVTMTLRARKLKPCSNSNSPVAQTTSRLIG